MTIHIIHLGLCTINIYMRMLNFKARSHAPWGMRILPQLAVVIIGTAVDAAIDIDETTAQGRGSAVIHDREVDRHRSLSPY